MRDRNDDDFDRDDRRDRDYDDRRDHDRERPEWDRHVPYRDRDDTVAGPPKKSPTAAILGGVFSLAVGYALLAFNLGWFPFAGINGVGAVIKRAINTDAKIAVESVEVTGDTTAVGTMPSGEKLTIRYRKEGGNVRYLCQKPKATAEADIRGIVSQLGYAAKTVTIRPSPDGGIGYVGEATAETGEVFAVTDNTDAANMTQVQYVKISPQSYPLMAKNFLEKELKGKVTQEGPHIPGDLPPFDGGLVVAPVQRESLYKCRMKCDGKWHAVELYTEESRFVMPQLGMPKPGDSTTQMIHFRAFEIDR